MTPSPAEVVPPLPRAHGAVNWSGLWAHSKRGVIVYLQYAAMTIGGPLVNGLLFLAVFSVALGDAATEGGVPFSTFVVPGIGMVMLIYQSFQQAAFMILDDKLEGMIADTLMAPLSPLEVMLGYLLQAVFTGLITGGLVTAVMGVLVGLPLAAPWTIAGFALLGAILAALVGVVAGLWAEKWEHYSAAENFLILPLGMLSGAFFSLDNLPEAARVLISANPVFYLIDGFRSGFTGQGTTSAALGIALLLGLILLLWGVAWRLFAIGYKLKP